MLLIEVEKINFVSVHFCVRLVPLPKIYFFVLSQGSEKILRLLIDKGAVINAVDRNRQTALDVALEANETKGIFKQKL